MKKKRERYFGRLVIFAVATALVVSFVALTAYTTGEQKPGIAKLTLTDPGMARVRGWAGTDSKGVVWDNGMHYSDGLISQDDTAYGMDATPADDFMFGAGQLVTGVHWIGAYGNGPPDDGDFDWRIIFYNDFGGGTKPGAAIASWVFPNADVNETFVEESLPGVFWYSYSVDLPAVLSFLAGTKYWISIQGVGALPPMSYWAMHRDPILLHQSVFKSELHGYPDWTNTSVVLGLAYDMCFQLTYEEGEWPNHKMHFPQEPDLIGWDVNATFPKTLADDWQCSETGLVTDIHFWGSWKDLDGNPATDDYYTPMPWFQLSIHKNIPATADTPWSRPGEQVWFWEGEIPGTPSEPPTMEHWLDPNTGTYFCNDHVPYWRYDFVDIPEPFVQYKDSIYWLNVSALYIEPPYQWGWKNSRDHFMDDATFTDNAPFGPWSPIVEPPRCNWFDALFLPGSVEDHGSTNYYGSGWYLYPTYNWFNMWFYDNPFTLDRQKHIWMEFYLDDLLMDAEFALNWSTPVWDEMGMGRPPLPEDGNEDVFIGRQEFPIYLGVNTIDFWLPYNPEWVSIDFRGTLFYVNDGWIWHECVGTSLDLAFVITGEPLPVICGDVNNDGIINIGDVVYLIGYLYKGGLPPVPMDCVGDVNKDGIVNIGDVVYLIGYLYKSGPAPSPLCCTPPWK